MLLNNRSIDKIKGIAYKNEYNKIILNTDYPEIISLDNIPPLDFSLYPNFSEFEPYIEESRGCFAKCNFCVSSFTNNGRIRIKNYKIFEKELDNIIQHFPNLNYIEVLASCFGVNASNTLGIIKAIKKHKLTWATEIRVDTPWDVDNMLEKMVNSGLSTLIAGVESLSPEILLKMNKTKNPEDYIQRALKLIQKCREFPKLKLKFNIVMYLGETPQTFSQTLKILFENKDYLSAVRFSPLFVFPGSQLSKSITNEQIYKNDFWNKRYMFPINLSNYYNAELAATISREMQKIFNG